MKPKNFFKALVLLATSTSASFASCPDECALKHGICTGTALYPSKTVSAELFSEALPSISLRNFKTQYFKYEGQKNLPALGNVKLWRIKKVPGENKIEISPAGELTGGLKEGGDVQLAAPSNDECSDVYSKCLQGCRKKKK